MNIALIAHDNKKDDLIELVCRFKSIFQENNLYATGTTGKRLVEATGLEIHRFLSGPLGGDQQIGARITTGEIDLVIFLRDPLTAQPHNPDVEALVRLCDVHHIPIATNQGSAELIIKAMKRIK